MSLDALGALLDPAVLFFALGFLAAAVRSDLAIPEAVGKGLSIYLVLAIGLKGGAALSGQAAGGTLAAGLIAGIVLSLLMPLIAIGLLRVLIGRDRQTVAAIAGHYGSVSLVTFLTAVNFLDGKSVPYEGFMPAVLAAMETPALVVAILLARGRDGGAAAFSPRLIREVTLNGMVVLLLGSFIVGMLISPTSVAKLQPFLSGIFPGLLCLFLLDMGLAAARQLRAGGGVPLGGWIFAVTMPLIGATVGIAAGATVGLSVGGTVLLGAVAASASYIAAPAVLRVAIPKANIGLCLTLSLGITFPFNVVLGIPAYYTAANYLSGH